MTQHFTAQEWYNHKHPSNAPVPQNARITTNYTPAENMERYKKAQATKWDFVPPSPKDTSDPDQLSPRTKKIIEEAEPLHKRMDDKKKKAAAEKEKEIVLKQLKKINKKRKAAAEEEKKKKAGEEDETSHKPLSRVSTDSSLASSVDVPSRLKKLSKSARRVLFVTFLCLFVGANLDIGLMFLTAFLLLLFFSIDVGVYFYGCYTGKETTQWQWLTDLFNAYVLVGLFYLFAGKRN